MNGRKVCAKCGAKHYEWDMYLVDFGIYKKAANICHNCIIPVLYRVPSIVYPERDRNNLGYDLNVRRVQELINSKYGSK